MSGVRSGGQDWLEIWRRMYDGERAQGEAATDPNFGRFADPWASQAGRFAAASRRQPQPDSFMRLLLPRLRPDDTVIDVGAGSGRYLPVLAAAVREVVALEPSPAMRAEMAQVIAEHGLGNVRVLASSWPPAEPIRAEVLISAHVVYGVREVGPFLQAMDAAAARACYLYLGLRQPMAALAPFWARVHGAERLPLPAALEALACLHQLGIAAGLELVPAPGSFRFSDSAEALDEIRHRLRLSPDPARDALIAAAARELLTRDDAGWLLPRNQPAHAAVIGWAPATNRADSSYHVA
jgi:SAM-dependent methyltransferase